MADLSPIEQMALSDPQEQPASAGLSPIEKLAQEQPAAPPAAVAPSTAPETAPADTGANPPMGAPASAIAAAAWQNLGPSFAKNAGDAYQAVRHLSTTLGTIGDIGSGIKSKIGKQAGYEASDPQNEKLVDALGQMYADRWGSSDKALHTLATDPVGALLDASMVTPVAELGAARLPGAAGRAAEVAATVGRAINPFDPLGVVSGGVEKAASLALPASTDAVTAAKTAGKLTGADLAAHFPGLDADNQTAMVGAVGKGNIEEAALRAQGLNAPRSILTGVAPKPEFAPYVATALEDNQLKIGKMAQDIAGAEKANPMEMARALEDAQVAAHNNYTTAYQKLAQTQGTFDPAAFAKVDTHIEDALQRAGGIAPNLTAFMNTAKNTHIPQAQEAVKIIRRQTAPGGNPMGGADATFQGLENTRQQLNNLFSSASGTDRAALRAVIDGYDNAVEHAVANQMFFDGSGAPMPLPQTAELLNNMQQARNGYRQYINTFVDDKTAPNLMSAMKMIRGDQTKATSGLIEAGNRAPDTTLMAAQKGLGDAMLRPQTGPLVHQTVVDAVGGPASNGAATANDFARQSLLQTNGGKLVRPVKELDTHLYNPHSIADRVFSPAELQSLRVANFNRATMAKRPAFSAKLHAGFASELSKWGSRAASAAVGHALGTSLGVPLGEAGGLLLEQIGERVAKGRGLPHELNAVGKPPSRVAAIRGAVTAPTRNAVLAQLGRQQQPSPQATPPKVTSVTPLVKAFHDQESGGGRDISTSANNAHGDMQITPETFAKYALPGEHIDNRDDNMAVGKRILEDYEKRYDGDAARIATAYFSGPGNVAPPGSPTPWLEDRHDGSGKRVSSYVADIVNRLSRPQRASGGRTGINHAEHAAALVRAADRAKKANGQQTSALLNVADATIAKALYVANRSI